MVASPVDVGGQAERRGGAALIRSMNAAEAATYRRTLPIERLAYIASVRPFMLHCAYVRSCLTQGGTRGRQRYELWRPRLR